jgi:hypothetical protein
MSKTNVSARRLLVEFITARLKARGIELSDWPPAGRDSLLVATKTPGAAEQAPASGLNHAGLRHSIRDFGEG